MPNISSPSQSPAIRQQSSTQGANNLSYGIGSAYGASAYPASPSYGVSIGAGRPGAAQTTAQGAKPAGAVGAKMYDIGADAAKNSDSSDSDDK